MNHATRTTAQWQAADLDNYLHPFTDYKALRETRPTIIVRGEGCWVWDSDGNRYLDGLGGLACVNIGYGRAELADAAATQMKQLSYFNSFFKSSNIPAIRLSEKLVSLTPDGLNHVFYANSGSEANDTALRMVRNYRKLEGRPERRVVIAREWAYHGSTVASGALSGMAPMHAQGAEAPDIVHIPPPYQFGLGRDMSAEDFGRLAAGWLEEKILEVGPDNVAAFFAEPVQGAGGGKIPPANYFAEVQRICRKYDVLLVIDEVICGFGRTGKWFACETFDIKPDLLILAKGITSGYIALSAVMVGDRLADTLIDKGGEFYHGFTYSGHPVSSAVALENLRILEEEAIVERVGRDTAPYFAERLQSLAGHPMVAEVRTCGLIGAVELVRSRDPLVMFDPDLEECELFRDRGLANGIITRPIGSTIMLTPPLVITAAEIDFLVDRFAVALEEFAGCIAQPSQATGT